MIRLLFSTFILLSLWCSTCPAARAQAPATQPNAQPAAPAATATPATAAPTTTPSPTEKTEGDDGRTWLQVGAAKQPAFYLREMSGTTYGGVLIIPDNGSHPESRGSVDRLRRNLADNHWHTLALDISGLDPDTIQQAVAAGVAFLNNKGVFNIAIIGRGRGAAHALRYIAAIPPAQGGKIHQIRALVMVNADNAVAGLGREPMAPLAKLRLPVLDAYTATDLDQQRQATARRRLGRPGNKKFQQIRLPDAIGVRKPDRESQESKRIRGWLDNNVAGYMVGGEPKN